MNWSPYIEYNLKIEYLKFAFRWDSKIFIFISSLESQTSFTSFLFLWVTHQVLTLEIPPDVVCFTPANISKAIRKAQWFLTILVRYITGWLHREWVSNIQQIHLPFSGYCNIFQIWKRWTGIPRKSTLFSSLSVDHNTQWQVQCGMAWWLHLISLFFP